MHRPTVAAFAAASLAAVVAVGVTAPAFAGNDDSARSTTSSSASHSEVESHDASEHATPEVEVEHSATAAATAPSAGCERQCVGERERAPPQAEAPQQRHSSSDSDARGPHPR